jgi:hypothetical protein
MKANELRIGNLIEYLVYDYLTPQKEWLENYVDIQDLQWLNENPDDDCYRPMKLTEDILVRLGFESNPYMDRYEKGPIFIECDKTKGFIDLWIENWPHIKSAHQLQNLYFALTGEELTL